MIKRRLNGLLMIAALAHMSLSPLAARCASPYGAAESAMAHHSTMTSNGVHHEASPRGPSQSELGVPSGDDSQPCSHAAGSDACRSMLSCATVAAMSGVVRTSGPVTPPVAVLAASSLAPSAPALAPESPPPRG